MEYFLDTNIFVNELLNVDVRLTVELFRASGVGSYDCAHAAIMKRIGLDAIVSTGPHFESITGISRLDPMNYLGESPRPRFSSMTPAEAYVLRRGERA